MACGSDSTWFMTRLLCNDETCRNRSRWFETQLANFLTGGMAKTHRGYERECQHAALLGETLKCSIQD